LRRVTQMRVLLSIRPEFAFKIFDGSKKYEYRRSIFRRSQVTRVIVYASDPVCRVIGEFEIGDILHEEPEVLWEKTWVHAGITKERFLDYFRGRPKGYAIQVTSTRLYESPVPLRSLMVSSPPQSFVYVAEENLTPAVAT
jgi:predicted transcriptional regulator